MAKVDRIVFEETSRQVYGLARALELALRGAELDPGQAPGLTELAFVTTEKAQDLEEMCQELLNTSGNPWGKD